MQYKNLIGESVILVPMENDHLDGLWEAARPEEIWAFMATKIRNKNEMKSAVEAALNEKDKGSQLPFVIQKRGDGCIIGSTRFLDISLHNQSLEIGWTWLNPSQWKTRVNTECKFLLLSYAFEELGINRAQIKTDGRNIRSQRAIERLGAVKEGILRQERKLADGYIRDTVVYSILASEWENVKCGILGKLDIKASI